MEIGVAARLAREFPGTQVRVPVERVHGHGRVALRNAAAKRAAIAGIREPVLIYLTLREKYPRLWWVVDTLREWRNWQTRWT